MWKGTVEPQRAFQRRLSEKKNKVYKCIHPNLQGTGWREHYILQHSGEKKPLTQLFLTIWKSKVNVFLILFAAYLSPAVTAIWPAGRSETLRERERQFVCCVGEEWDDSLSYVLTCLCSLERNQQHLVCKTTSEDRNRFYTVQEKRRFT